MIHVFVHKENPSKIKMIEANSMERAHENLEKRLLKEYNSGIPTDYKFGYYL